MASEEPFIEVEIKAELSYDNGDFSYSGTHCTHGVDGVANCGASIEVDGDLEYDRSKYTSEELSIIDKYIEDNRKEIEIELSENY